MAKHRVERGPTVDAHLLLLHWSFGVDLTSVFALRNFVHTAPQDLPNWPTTACQYMTLSQNYYSSRLLLGPIALASLLLSVGLVMSFAVSHVETMASRQSAPDLLVECLAATESVPYVSSELLKLSIDQCSPNTSRLAYGVVGRPQSRCGRRPQFPIASQVCSTAEGSYIWFWGTPACFSFIPNDALTLIQSFETTLHIWVMGWSEFKW